MRFIVEPGIGRGKQRGQGPVDPPPHLTINVTGEQVAWPDLCELCRHGRAELGMRHSTQSEALRNLPGVPDDENPLLSDLLAEPDEQPIRPVGEWAYRRFTLNIEGDVSTPAKKKRWHQIDDVNPGPLYLFNIVVALEWHADEDYLQQLRWAFRRASDHLYDLTDGMMAFGQVIFGGPELMDGADIQIMASNRLHPRSWVEGLHNPLKYTPIRMGRELWSGRNRVAYAWVEPEGYRTLVHEWLHYAVCLKDGYLTNDKVTVVDKNGTSTDIPIRIPIAPASIDSATQDTTISELSPADQMEKIKKKLACYFPDLPQTQWSARTGPHRMPGQFPVFDQLPSLKVSRAPVTLGIADIETSVSGLTLSPAQVDTRKAKAERRPPNELDPELQELLRHCWVYVLRAAQAAGTGDHPAYTHLIPQGTLSTLRYRDQPFQLLGAEPGDTVVLVSHKPGDPMQVFRQAIDPNGKFTSRWQLMQPDAAMPLITVLPHLGSAATPTPPSSGTPKPPGKREVQVQVTGTSLPGRLWIFPLGQEFSGGGYARELAVPQSGGVTDKLEVPTLDGHVLAEWATDQFFIYPFSQGGGPPNHEPVGSSPVTAGSTDGKVMLFFYKEEEEGTNDAPCAPEPEGSRDYLKMITTMSYGDLGEPCPPDSDDPPVPNGQQVPTPEVGSYIYGLSASEELSTDLTPTLVFFYDRPLEGSGTDFNHKPVVYRLVAQGGGFCWKSLAAYGHSRLHSPYVAIPLTPDTAPGLFNSNTQEVEHYRLYWVQEPPCP